MKPFRMIVAICALLISFSSTLAADLLTLSDFSMQSICYSTVAEMLKKKGFSENEDPTTGETKFKKGNTEVVYSEDFGDDGGGCRYICITLPDFDDGWKFIEPLRDNRQWKMERTPTGEIFTKDMISIYHECSYVQIQICSE